MSRQKMRISEIARLVRVTPKTIRHYHKIGLIAEPERSEADYRLYEARHVIRLHCIVRLKSLGLSLYQIKHILDADNSDHALKVELQRLHKKLLEKIATLNTQLEQVAHHLAEEPTLQAVTRSDAIDSRYQQWQAKVYSALGEGTQQTNDLDKALLERLTAFEWQHEQHQQFEEVASQIVNDDELQAFGRALMEQFVMLADVPADSPEVVSAAWTVAQSEGGDKVRQLAAAQTPDNDVHQHIFETTLDSVAADLYSPAQYRFFQVLGDMLRR